VQTDAPIDPTVTGGDEHDHFYIRTPAALADDRNLVLKQNDTFVVLDRYGDILPVGLAEEGLYHEGTRYLSRLSVRIGGQRALLLSSAVKQDNALITVDLTNLDVDYDGMLIPRGVLYVSRTIVVWDGSLHERLQIRNYSGSALATTVQIEFDADYADIFEVRGTVRPKRGTRLRSLVEHGCIVLNYHGLDDVVRRTRVCLTPWPDVVTARRAEIPVRLEPGAEQRIDLQFICESGDLRPKQTFSVAVAAASDSLASRRAGSCEILTSNTQFNEWRERSLADLSMMMTDTSHGPFPYAGVPWFSTPFGRDCIITALECLWAMPDMARAVLRYLAATQATEIDPARDAQPGKILHEARLGEMAALGEIPFGRYYGSHDATPLFVMLAAAYYDRTADRTCIEEIWPNIKAALDWIERDGDMDGDGFIEYMRQSPTGLVQQGWKDSHDSVFHQDGHSADGPIALCEIQGYVYAAWQGAARLARMMGRRELADALALKAARLQARFDEAFWCEDIGTYALALDGEKRPCRIIASNAGHTLVTGIASAEHANRVARSLVTPESFSGWGIRTVASSEARYNPMSYHNGSIWPHDNALIAAGLSRFGYLDEALLVMDGLFQASTSMNLHRLPELFCGFAKRGGENPTLYPVACSPQSWASAAVFMLLQASLGLEICATSRSIRFTRAKLPDFLDEVRLSELRVGDASVDLILERQHNDVSINVLKRTGQIEIVAIK
jgi:glycogen debranching enzyme